MSSLSTLDEIRENLAFLDGWEDRDTYLIELGEALPQLVDAERTETNKVRGCVAQVWVVTEPRADGTIGFRGNSDSALTKGRMAVLIALYSGRPATEIAATDAIEVFDELGLRNDLPLQRSNGLRAMIARMRGEAAALAAA